MPYNNITHAILFCQGCQPYALPQCEHDVPGPKHACKGDARTPKCQHKCQPGYNKTFEQDKHYGEIYSLEGEGEGEWACVINEIFI